MSEENVTVKDDPPSVASLSRKSISGTDEPSSASLLSQKSSKGEGIKHYTQCKQNTIPKASNKSILPKEKIPSKKSIAEDDRAVGNSPKLEDNESISLAANATELPESKSLEDQEPVVINTQSLKYVQQTAPQDQEPVVINTQSLKYVPRKPQKSKSIRNIYKSKTKRRKSVATREIAPKPKSKPVKKITNKVSEKSVIDKDVPRLQSGGSIRVEDKPRTLSQRSMGSKDGSEVVKSQKSVDGDDTIPPLKSQSITHNKDKSLLSLSQQNHAVEVISKGESSPKVFTADDSQNIAHGLTFHSSINLLQLHYEVYLSEIFYRRSRRWRRAVVRVGIKTGN